MRTPAALAVCALLFWTTAAARPAGVAAQDLDAFMEKVLARRDDNWKQLQQYVLDEREQVEIRGPGNVPVWGDSREYTWYLNDGFFVRSPVKANGVTVAESDRRKYEADFLRRVKERDKPPDKPDTPDAPDGPGEAGDVQALIRQTRRPQFIDTAYFLKFQFEPSKYALVGRELFEGREVLAIDYYPARMLGHEQEMQQRRVELKESNPNRDRKAALERMINKVALVTIWVDPGAHQIVKYTLDNANLEFLPASWLLHMDTAKAVMTMGQPVPGVWLPRDVDMRVGATMAIGSFDVRYHVDYTNYRKADTNSNFRVVP